MAQRLDPAGRPITHDDATIARALVTDFRVA